MPKNSESKYTNTLTNSAEFGIVNQRDYFDHNVSNIDNIHTYYIVQSLDFVYNPRISTSAPVGPINCNKLGYNGVMSPLYTVFRFFNQDVNFLEQYFKSNKWHDHMRLNGDSGARFDRFSIKDDVFFQMPVCLPPISEQFRIGAFFGELDKLIAKQEEKVEKLRKLKKAFLYKMFPQQGSYTPVIRFFGSTSNWQGCKMGELTNVITKGTTPVDNTDCSDDVNFVKIENIHTVSGEIFPVTKISNNAHHGYLKRSILKENDILFSIAGTLGRVAIVTADILPANTNQALSIIRLGSGNLRYIKTYLNSYSVKDYIAKTPTMGAQVNLSLEQIRNLPIKYPNILEQTKIGAFFQMVDDLIILQGKKLEKLKNFKKAFLCKMFI